MSKELIIVYSGTSVTYSEIISSHNPAYYLKFFDKIHILYWAEEEDGSEVFTKNNEKFIFYPYCRPYNTGYITGIKFMTWIGKTLWKICGSISKDTKLILMPVIPIWAGLPTLIVGRLKRKKVFLRLEAQKMDYLRIDDEALGVPKIFTVIKILILKIIYFLTIPLYDYVIGISNDVVNEAKHYGAKKSIWIPISIDLTFYQSSNNIKKNREGIVLSVGQIKKRKGFGEVIKALQILKKEDGLTPKLLIVGGVSDRRDEIFLHSFKKMATGLNIEFTGQVRHEELIKIYNQVDIFVLASYLETLGMVIMEAMSSGLPVIATRTSGAKDLVKDGKTGFLVPIKDPIAIKEKIKVLLENPDLRKSMGQAGRERIKKIMRTVDENNKKLLEMLGIVNTKQ